MSGVTKSRWRKAQRYERGYWDSRSRQIEGGGRQLGWYCWRAERLAEHLEAAGCVGVCEDVARVLEVGSGPVGIVSFLDARVRVAIDPLARFYASDETLSAKRSDEVVYLTAMGEHLPVPDAHFDLVIVDNCIDHVQDVDAVLEEIERILRPDGVLYLTVNVRTPTGAALHRVLSRLALDAGHPHSFTASSARRLVGERSFRLLHSEVEDYREAKRKDLAADSWKTKAKGLLGISEFLVTLVGRRPERTSGRVATTRASRSARSADSGPSDPSTTGGPNGGRGAGAGARAD